jgi:riboflavin biosynthesis pyrimidine reductase
MGVGRRDPGGAPASGVPGEPGARRARLRRMRRLFPSSTSSTAASAAPAASAAGQWSLDALAEEYAYPEQAGTTGAGTVGAGAGPRDSGAWLRANMVTSLDGAAHHDGHSQPLSGPADMRLFGVLRGLADAVIVGAETVRTENYRPARERQAFASRRAAAGQGPAPAIAVVSSSLRLDFSARLFSAPLVPTLLVTGAGAASDRIAEARKAGVEVVFAGEGAVVEPSRVALALAERGLRRLLTEGGPRLLGQFVAADALDELCLTVAPRLTSGEAPRIADGPGLATPSDFRLAGVLEEDGFLFTRYRRTGGEIGQSAE